MTLRDTHGFEECIVDERPPGKQCTALLNDMLCAEIMYGVNESFGKEAIAIQTNQSLDSLVLKALFDQ